MPYKDPEKRRECLRRFRKNNPDYDKKRYRENIEYYRENGKSYKQKLRRWFADYKSKLVCSLCGSNENIQFHHFNTKDKLDSISNLVAHCYSMEKIKNEITKCDVLCRTCHIKLHHI